MSSVASLSPLLVLLLTVSFYPYAARSEVLDSTGYGNDSLCPVSEHDNSNFCSVRCFRPDPVCGEDGQTYWCGCPDAACARVRVVKYGPCEVGNGGSGLISGQAFFLIHIVWLIILGLSVLCGFF